ncbi:hypothetical protein IDJ77_23920 [Mucilaginibacter sp. ZT4R22]|uniref:Uncharacterized protein n=1 Tax=Mucilaginibacter pankratovii TaxID=2772110 RepID=A0ABR7WX84_9SPHI|nr:hypothetical protein [Mucilaginibacter pankratovii]MBD1366879.1 hypothetical protein [Mucilaginibacter pankratovii]
MKGGIKVKGKRLKQKGRSDIGKRLGDAFGPAYRQAGRAIRSNSSFRAADRSSAPFRGFHCYPYRRAGFTNSISL